jgi:hypothetical protein
LVDALRATSGARDGSGCVAESVPKARASAAVASARGCGERAPSVAAAALAPSCRFERSGPSELGVSGAGGNVRTAVAARLGAAADGVRGRLSSAAPPPPPKSQPPADARAPSRSSAAQARPAAAAALAGLRTAPPPAAAAARLCRFTSAPSTAPSEPSGAHATNGCASSCGAEAGGGDEREGGMR